MRIVPGLISLMVFASACTYADPGVQRRLGSTVYMNYCQSCHEVPGTGPRLTSAVLASRLTAERLYTYNKQQMPYNAEETLSNEDYLNVTAWLLQRADLIEPDLVLTQQNMESLFIAPTEESLPSDVKP